MARRLFARRKSSQRCAVDEENIKPAIVVVIVKSDSAPGRFEKILVLVLAAEDRFRVESGFARDVHKPDAQLRGRGRRPEPAVAERPCGCEYLVEAQHERRPAQGLKKVAAGRGQQVTRS